MAAHSRFESWITTEKDKSGISADMAIRLEKAFGGAAETRLRLQMAYDLAQARRHEGDIDVKPVSRRKLHELHP
jgi:plasmid maintenance system antidote protein VapI